MEFWFTEVHTPNFQIKVRVNRTLEVRRTTYQEMAVLDTVDFGRMLVLDGYIQTTEADEFIYHEMIAHVPLFTHSNPQRVLVIGGGDGGVVREVLRHKSVEAVDHVEIDEAVTEASRRWLPSISHALDDPRVQQHFTDGVEFVRLAAKKRGGVYDVIIVDSTDPLGPAVGLFGPVFYRNCRNALRPGGLLTVQSESPWFTRHAMLRSFHGIRRSFPLTKVYLAHIPTYSTYAWSFTIASDGVDPEQADIPGPLPFETNYYTPAIHRAAFALPAFLGRILAAPEPEDLTRQFKAELEDGGNGRNG
ncbi:MAG: polyamine aminopropyltransferase [Bacillota bacterium]|jgi:spermidine synthase|nr:MAG: polyamine aminopropyltransferase [Bacillota bacterium]